MMNKQGARESVLGDRQLEARSNPLLKLLKLQRPIIQGGMGNISPVELCVAVSKAGGLGQIGAGTLALEELSLKIKQVQKQLGHDTPFGLNIPLMVHPQVEDVVNLALREQIPIVTLSAGNPKPWIPILKEHGIKVMVVVAAVEQAQKAEQAGADTVIGEGFEAAGKNSPKELTTFALLPQLRQSLSIPIIAAGGIGDGHGLLAAFALGASGVQLGTRLIATQEAVVHELYKQALLEAKDEDTIVLGRRNGFVTRLLNTPYSRKLFKLEQEGASLEQLQQALDEHSHERGALQGLLTEGHVNAGQISGLIQSIPTVKDLFEEMELTARQRLEMLRHLFN